MNLLISNKKWVVVNAVEYGFNLPVVVDRKVWVNFCNQEVENSALDLLMKTYASELVSHNSRTDIVFNCGIPKDGEKHLVAFKSSLEFDDHVRPYLTVEYH